MIEISERHHVKIRWNPNDRFIGEYVYYRDSGRHGGEIGIKVSCGGYGIVYESVNSRDWICNISKMTGISAESIYVFIECASKILSMNKDIELFMGSGAGNIEALVKENAELKELVNILRSDKIDRKSNGLLNKTTYLYLMRNGQNGLTKIGISNNPRSRRNTLKSYEIDLVILALFCFSTRPEAQDNELMLHRRYSAKRISGEWFNLTSEDIDYIKSAYRKNIIAAK